MHPSRIVAAIVLALTLIGAVLSPNPGVLALGGLVLAVGIIIVWTESAIPIMLLPFLLQWIPIALKPIETAITGAPLNDLSRTGGDLESTAIFAFVGLLCFAVGTRVSWLGTANNQMRQLSLDADQWTASGITYLSLAMIVIGHLLAAGFGHYGGLNEAMSTLSTITYSGLFILYYWSYRTGKNRKLALLIVIFELIFGMTGFFGQFKTALFVAAIALICSQQKISARSIIMGSLVGAVAMFAMVFWSAIKPDYRTFLNQGQRVQGTNRPMSERLGYLYDRTQDFDREKFYDGFDRLIDRASYIDFLSATREYVPANTPFEGGTRTLAGISHVLAPRIFYPDKPPLESDTEVTAKYTALTFGDANYVSISIGYFGELYIDYGDIGAFIALAIFGFLIGSACRGVLSYKKTPMVLNAGLAIMLSLPFWYFEQALVKVIGSMVMSMLLVFGMQRFLFGSLLSGVVDQLRLPRRAPVMVPGVET